MKYTDKFNHAYTNMLLHEGGLVSDPVDPGGTTKWGVSLRTLQRLDQIDRNRDGQADYDFNSDGAIDATDIIEMSPEEAKAFYRHEFWDKYGFEQLPFEIAVKLFDLAVNMGPSTAVKCLQRAIKASGETIVVDGVIGPDTLSKTLFQSYLIMPALRSEAAGFYRSLIAARPVFEKYRTGWLKRAYS